MYKIKKAKHHALEKEEVKHFFHFLNLLTILQFVAKYCQILLHRYLYKFIIYKHPYKYKTYIHYINIYINI